MIKKAIIALGCLLPALSWAQQKKTYVLDGKIAGDSMVNGKVYISWSDNGEQFSDSTVLTHNTYHFAGTIQDGAVQAALFWREGYGRQAFRGFVSFYLQPGQVSLTHTKKFAEYTITGATVQSDFDRLRKQISSKAQTEAVANKNYIQTHPSSWLSYILLQKLVKDSLGKLLAGGDATVDLSEAAQLYKGLSPALKKYRQVAALQPMISAAQATAIGQMAADFTEKDTSGHPVSLSSFRGKYVFIDFWASWCHPCRAENPNVARAYHAYKSKGFEVLGVSLDGAGSKAAWIKAIRQDGVDWTQICALQGGLGADEVSMKYGVVAIPTNFLIDPKGRIVARNLRGEALHRKLAEIFGANEGAFTIEGTTNKPDGTLFFLPRFNPLKGQYKDSAVVTNGKFVFKGTVAGKELTLLMVGQDMRQESLRFYLEPGTIHVSCPADAKHALVTGTPLNDDFQPYKTSMQAFVDSVNGSGIGGMGISEFSNEALGKKLTLLKQLIREKPASDVTMELLTEYASKKPVPDTLEPLFNALSADNKQTQEGKDLATRIAGMRAAVVGGMAPVFTQADTSGHNVSLTDFRGKYVLLDFWASWCGPCRAENPNEAKAYKLYGPEGFIILGVSLDSKLTRDAWLKAIQNDHLTWPQVSDLGFWNNAVAKMYNINSVPSNFLIDPQGKIVAKNLRGEALQSALVQLFKKNM